MRHNYANNMTLPNSYHMRFALIFGKIDSFLKNVSNVFDIDKGIFTCLKNGIIYIYNCWLTFVEPS